MNANELIKELEFTAIPCLQEAATMLRQQQAEIEELKTKMSLNSYDDAKNVANQLLQSDNEPVAWMSVELDGRTVLATYEFETAIPLYTHPANLTDEEIAEVYEQCEWASGYVYWKEFARAILRKAQEK